MKKSISFPFIILFFVILIRQTALSLDIGIAHASFSSEKEKYTEIYLYVVGSTVNYTYLDDSSMQAAVEFTITFSRNNQIVNFDKFILNSPVAGNPGDFVGIKRFALQNGRYELNVDAVDLNDPENIFRFEDRIELDFDPTAVGLSDLQMLARFETSDAENDFVKNGLYLEPAPFNFYPESLDKLAVYLEVYNPSADPFKAAYLSYGIYDTKNNMISQRFKKLAEKRSQAMILQLPIDELRSGNYELMVELRNRDKLLVDVRSVSFQRSNLPVDLQKEMSENPGFERSFSSQLDEEEVIYSLRAITPLLTGDQSLALEQILRSDELRSKQYFLYQYFFNQYPIDPALAYGQFMEVARAVDRSYRSNVGYGFETDRGKIFIKYGKPTEVVHVEDEPSAPPYEIWFYNKLEESKQYNIKFLFYNPSLAANDYELLHSNCRGERNNPRWEVQLYDNAPNEQVGQNAASTEMQDNYRRNARRIWEEM
jgi:GWxTD domain-containing protein